LDAPSAKARITDARCTCPNGAVREAAKPTAALSVMSDAMFA
jgi:hypothetical protein